jgi:amino acid adenylation domain-containing protein
MKNGLIQEMLHSAAERFPDRTAISSTNTSCTFAQLEARSNSLANSLIRRGAAAGSIVAILTSDISLSILAILGTLKAGCVFVPLDAATPVRRLTSTIADLDPQWCLVDDHYFPLLSGMVAEAGLSPHMVSLTGALPTRTDDSAHPPSGLLAAGGTDDIYDPTPPTVTHDPDQMAYVYFTSGSTGKPKGIAGRLKGIDHFIRWQIETFALDETTRVSQLLPLSFDGSLRDIFVPLTTGGCICVPPSRDVILNARELVNWLDAEQVTLVHCVPSLFRALLNAGLHAEELGSLRQIMLAGEVVLPADVARWMQVYGERVKLVNLYGTSETTMAKFYYEISAADCERQTIPVGKPMSGARAVLLDERGRVCPVGAVGEIYIRTPYRSLGYYKEPEMTKEAFVRNPLNDDPKDIVYRTGDLGRILEDGNYEYLGRKDQQVKVRGVRVELGEVENVLRGHEQVRDVAVVDREDEGGNKYLCAYVVVEGGIKEGELREFAQGMLPDYMVPSAYIEMETLPRTLSGKVDRRALPSVAQARSEGNFEYIPPRTAVEEAISDIWCKVLGLKRVSIRDSFFVLGGHSLLATQVISRMREELHVELPISSLFDTPTIEGLAATVVKRQLEMVGDEDLAELLAELDHQPEA